MLGHTDCLYWSTPFVFLVRIATVLTESSVTGQSLLTFRYYHNILRHARLRTFYALSPVVRITCCEHRPGHISLCLASFGGSRRFESALEVCTTQLATACCRLAAIQTRLNGLVLFPRPRFKQGNRARQPGHEQETVLLAWLGSRVSSTAVLLQSHAQSCDSSIQLTWQIEATGMPKMLRKMKIHS